LVLALAMVFSTITVAFAEGTLGEDAQVCADLGMLQGETGTVDAAYVATAPTRLQAAVMFLRLKGLEAEALAFTGEDNFADGEIAWAQGANLIAYLKANPQLGWIGDGTNFNPTGAMTAQAYYKVLLEALGYKQTTAEVAGDFTWAEVFTFAASVGLSKVADVTNYTVNDLAIATVEALKLTVKGTETTLVGSLIATGVVDEAKAVAAGLVEAAPAAVAVAVKEAKATGNAVVEVTFTDAVDAAAANVANYAIEGLAVNAAAISGEKTVILDTDAMTSGKIYKLTVGEKTVQFAGVAKVSGGPEINTAKGVDIEEVVIEFNKNIDLATGSDVANYSISGVEILSAEVDEDEVTLTTEGLKNKTKYTVKVTNIKSVDGVAKKSQSKAFTTNFDLTAPKLNKVEARTNQRLVVFFNEEVTQESAEDIANYVVKVNETDGAEMKIISITWDDDNEDNVEIITEQLESNEKYKVTVNGLVDQTKSANTMTRPSTSDEFRGPAEDKKGPKLESVEVLSPTTIVVEFSDASNIDEESALDINNYELKDRDIDLIETLVDNDYDAVAKEVTFKALLTVEEMDTGKTYDLTINDVLDEFGNSIAADTLGKAKASTNNLAAAQVVSMTTTGKNTILVVFDKEVDEATAENIANYSIDEGIGAPRKAEYEKDLAPAKSVTLTVANLVNGYDQYDLTINNVIDLAGNNIYYKAKVTNNVSWETDKPALEDVDPVNVKVVELTFDERVRFGTGTTMKLKYNNYANEIDLTAKAVSEDGKVVEFSGASNLTANTTYTVYSFAYGADATKTGITDLILNVFEFVYNPDSLITFEGSASTYDQVEVDTYEQTNAKTFEVTFDKDVKFAAGKDGTTDMNGFKAIKIDDNVVTFKMTTGTIVKNDDYGIDLSANFVDMHGVAIKDRDSDTDKTVFTGEYTDTDAPTVDEVVAKHRTRVKLTLDEEIDIVDGTKFVLKNYDKSEEITPLTVLRDVDDYKVINITFTKPLEARYEYELLIKAGAVTDFAGKTNVEDTVYFDGTNLAK